LIGQYYQLLRLGKAGYRAVMSNLHDTAEWIAKEIEGMGIFTILSDREGKGVPLVAWKLTEPHKFDEFAIGAFGKSSLTDRLNGLSASTLRSKGWIVPACTFTDCFT
jgi:glutamate decarboxylase